MLVMQPVWINCDSSRSSQQVRSPWQRSEARWGVGAGIYQMFYQAERFHSSDKAVETIPSGWYVD